MNTRKENAYQEGQKHNSLEISWCTPVLAKGKQFLFH